jgi:hypothetical protein
MRGLRGERRRHPPPLGRLALLLCWVLVVGGSGSNNGAAGGFHEEEAGVAAAAGSSDSVGGRRAAEGPRLYELNGERRKFPELHRQRANTKAPPKVVHLDRGRGSAAGGNDAEDQEVPLRVRWRANDRQSPPGERGEATAAGDATGEKNEGSSKRPPYRLPSETKEQLRSVLRQVRLEALGTAPHNLRRCASVLHRVFREVLHASVNPTRCRSSRRHSCGL